MGDLLMRRYITDFIAQAQQLSAPIYSTLPVDSNFTPTGDGAYFAIKLDGNESGIGWRGTDDDTLPSAGNERTKQHRVRPKKLYAVCSFSGLAEAVAGRGGEDAFAAVITDGISSVIKRSGAVFETTFLRGDGTGRLTNVNGAHTAQTTITVDDARPFRTGQVVVFLNNTTGLNVAGPVTVTGRSVANSTIAVSQAVTLNDNDGVYISGEQSEAAPPSEITMLGLPAIVNNTGTIYGLNRTTYPVLQSKVIAAGSTALDESLLRRLRTQLLTETDVGSVDGFGFVCNYGQFDRYTEISLPFRRFNDMRLDLGASVALQTHEGMPFWLSWAALPDEIFMIRRDAIARGVVRPLSIDPRVNMAWQPGLDAFTVLLKTYQETVCRNVSQTARLTGLTVPQY